MPKTKCIGTIWRAWQDQCPREFVDSLAQMLIYSQYKLCGPNEFINYGWSTVSWFETGRQEAIDNSIGEWVLMLDTDHMFAPDLLERMLLVRKKHNTRVLSGLYFSKHPGNHVPVANIWTPEGQVKLLTDWDEKADCMEIGPCGAGCLLVDRTVFTEIMNKLGQLPFSTIPGLSEDYSMFKRCRDICIKTYLAPQIENHHLGPREVLVHRGTNG